MFPKQSILQPIFDQFMRHLYESGIIDKILKTHQVSCIPDPLNHIAFDFVMIVFVILILGVITAMILLCIELYHSKVQTQ